MPGFCWHLAPNTFFALRFRASAMKMDVPKAPWTAAARRRLEIMPRTMTKAASSRRSPRCSARFLRRTSLYGPTLPRLLAAGRSPTRQSRYGKGARSASGVSAFLMGLRRRRGPRAMAAQTTSTVRRLHVKVSTRIVSEWPTIRELSRGGSVRDDGPPPSRFTV